MTIYHGIVRGNLVVLPEGVRLEEGLRVEVRTLSQDDALTEEEQREEQFRNRLVATGLLRENKRLSRQAPDGNHTPIQGEGKPLSQTIIEERR
jgi:hypothetical protein